MFIAQWQPGGMVHTRGRSFHDTQAAAERVVWLKRKAGANLVVWFYSTNGAALKETA